MKKEKIKQNSEGAQLSSLRSQDFFNGSLRSHLRAFEESAIFRFLAEYMEVLDDPIIPLKGKHALKCQLIKRLRDYHNERIKSNIKENGKS